MARRYGARLTLLHLIDYSIDDVPVEWLEPLDDSPADFLRRRALQALRELASKLGQEQAQIAVIEDAKSPAQAILRYTQEHEVDLVVVGTHVRHGLPHWLGSASTSVLHRTCCDVLAIRVGE